MDFEILKYQLLTMIDQFQGRLLEQLGAFTKSNFQLGCKFAETFGTPRQSAVLLPSRLYPLLHLN